MENLKRIFIIYALLVLLNLIVYVLLFELGYLVSWIIFGVLLVASILLMVALVITSLLLMITYITKQRSYRVKKYMVAQFTWFAFMMIACVLQVTVSEKFTFAPNTTTYASIESVELNGTTQYISVRSEDLSQPIILFLAGGPGGTQMVSTREFLAELEDEYTIINWDQPGVGKSYDARSYKDLTVDTYIEDAHALTLYLKETYQQEKIYLIGESWGSFLGILLSEAYPEDYYAFIGAGQMVDFTETEIACYNLAMEIAIEKNDQKQIDALKKIGVPPIYGKNVSMEIGTYLQYLHMEMVRNPEIKYTSWDTFDSLFAPEYSIMDSINFARGLIFTFSHVYQQLYGIDLREDYTEFDIPIYILHGRHDINAPVYLVEDYYQVINAPDKELIFFEESGHNPWINESELFNETVRNLFSFHN